MRVFKRIVLSLFILILILALAVFGLRMYNAKKYGSGSSNTTASYYSDPTNLDVYPKDIEGVEVKTISQNTLHGFHLIPKEKKHKGIVISYGGSEGAAGYDDAVMLAKEGYETFAAFMFGMENQPQELVKVPLEQFNDVLAYVKDNVRDDGPITVLGASKGAEYALNLATKYDEISAVVLRAPSAYNFAGLAYSKDTNSSWTWQGKELPYIDMTKSNGGAFISDVVLPMIVGAPVTYLPIYDSAIEKDADRNAALIPVKDTRAALLVIAGEEDEMWNSSSAAETIKGERPDNTIIKIYPGAGHVFHGDGVLGTSKMRIATGGSEEANISAHTDSEQLIKDFLIKNHR